MVTITTAEGWTDLPEVPEVLISEQWLRFHEWTTTAEDLTIIGATLAPLAGERLLDIGCGAGRLALPLAEQGVVVTGVDASRELLAEARQGAANRRSSASFAYADIRDLSRWANGFDCAIAYWQVLGYTDDDTARAMLTQMRSVLVAGGRFLIHVPTPQWLAVLPDGEAVEATYDNEGSSARVEMLGDRRAKTMDVRWTSTEAGRVLDMQYTMRFYTYRELSRWMRDAGFIHLCAYDVRGGAMHPGTEWMVVVASART